MKNWKAGMAVFLSCIILSGCGAGNEVADANQADVVSDATQARYREGEVTEYQGARLDPSIGPGDNSINGIQQVNLSDYRLEVTGLVEHPLELKYEEVLALEQDERKITLHCVDGWDATVLWNGIRIMELVDLAKAEHSANTVVFHSVDGYTTSLPLQTIKNRDLILAYGANGLDLPPELGYPFIVVAESRLGYKWARWVDEIELSDDLEYKGYWEQRGYDKDGDVPGWRLNP